MISEDKSLRLPDKSSQVHFASSLSLLVSEIQSKNNAGHFGYP
jgi:hypothetical protein